jgi:acyl-coenzyme A synthetase/AMP-(fatty) acid ligase
MQHWLLDRIAARGERVAFVSEDETVTYVGLASLVRSWDERLASYAIPEGHTVVVEGDHSASCFALLLALAARQCIVVPLTSLPRDVLEDRCKTAGADWLIDCLHLGDMRFEPFEASARPSMGAILRERKHAGLILFSSGSSGVPKACLLDLDMLFERARKEGEGYVTTTFLLFDHIGGLNTLINVLGRGGTVVVPRDRSVDAVTRAIATHRVELLPTSPTFLRMLLISDAPARRDLSSLKLITYGTEVMPEATLEALHTTFPNVRIKQTYGLSEIGIVPTRSRSPGSVWMQIGGEGVEHKVVDSILWLRVPTAMIGYLNAPNPFDKDGWFCTGDKVDVDGEYLRVLGRESELINVGGGKVHPAEIENVLLAAGNVRDVTVSGRASPVTGALVVAALVLDVVEDPGALRARLDRFCRERLEAYKVPMAYKIVQGPLHSERFKKIRSR